METKTESKKFLPVYFLILLLTLISFQIVSKYTIQQDPQRRIGIQDSILNGKMEPPYQYRIMKPLLGYTLQKLMSPVVKDRVKSHILSYRLIIFFVFLGIYILFYKYLRQYFSEQACMIGLLLLQIVIPLGITSIWEDGDYYTLLIYLIGLSLIFGGKDKFLPIIIFLGEFNRDQIIFLIVFYAIYLKSRDELFSKKGITIIVTSVILWLTAYYSMRFIFGFKESVYTFSHNFHSNRSVWELILELWIVQLLIYVILSIKTYGRSSVFFRWSLVSLIAYAVIFFFNGILSQLAKFLPAYLILIPMSLQYLTNEYTESKVNSVN